MYKIVSLLRAIDQVHSEGSRRMSSASLSRSPTRTRMSLWAVRLLIEDVDCGYGILTESHRRRPNEAIKRARLNFDVASSFFSLSPSPFFLRFAQRSTILQPVKGPSNCSIENEHLSRRLMATIRSSHAGSLFSLTVSSIFDPKPRP